MALRLPACSYGVPVATANGFDHDTMAGGTDTPPLRLAATPFSAFADHAIQRDRLTRRPASTTAYASTGNDVADLYDSGQRHLYGGPAI